MKRLSLGLLYAALWSSAAVASKIGLQYFQPFPLYFTRLFLAGFILLVILHLFFKDQQKWSQTDKRNLLIFAFLNTSVYLSAFVLAMSVVPAGIGTLAVSMGPLFVSFFTPVPASARFRQQTALLLGFASVSLATWPHILVASAGWPLFWGVVLLFFGVLSVSYSSVFYNRNLSHLDRFKVNAHQNIWGSLMMSPLLLLGAKIPHTFQFEWVASMTWMVFAVSIAAVSIYLYLLKIDPLRASFWLFITPIFGFVYAKILLDEPITWHTVVAGCGVIFALYLANSTKKQV